MARGLPIRSGRWACQRLKTSRPWGPCPPTSDRRSRRPRLRGRRRRRPRRRAKSWGEKRKFFKSQCKTKATEYLVWKWSKSLLQKCDRIAFSGNRFGVFPNRKPVFYVSKRPVGLSSVRQSTNIGRFKYRTAPTRSLKQTEYWDKKDCIYY